MAPGLIRSKWVDAQAGRYQSFIDETPLRRHGKPEDVANTVAFLVSEESAHITGQIINVSGGWYLTPMTHHAPDPRPRPRPRRTRCTSLGYPLFDSDNHYYETPDCFSRHIESRFADAAMTARRTGRGRWDVQVGDRPYNFMDVKFDKTNPPGSMHEILRKKDSASRHHVGQLVLRGEHAARVPAP